MSVSYRRRLFQCLRRSHSTLLLSFWHRQLNGRQHFFIGAIPVLWFDLEAKCL